MSSPALEVKIIPIDFSQTALGKPYSLFYAKVIDNLFTPDECADLLALAQASSEGSDSDPWTPAGLSAARPDGKQTVHSDFRNSDRVLVFDLEAAERIYQKLRPHVEEIHEIRPDGPWATITGKVGSKQAPTWTLAGVNNRLSFLRYRPGQYFKPHCDGLNEVDLQKSFVTLHLYLNDSTSADDPILPPTSSAPVPAMITSDAPIPSSVTLPFRSDNPVTDTSPSGGPSGEGDEILEGGATRFWTPDKKAYLDVFPKLGRVLIFQQRMLVHSGEAVTRGTKYTMRSDFMFENKS